MSNGENLEDKSNTDVESFYRAAIVRLAQTLIDAISTSQATQNLPSGETGKRFWASVLLARLCGLGGSLQRILPGSPSNKSGRVWESAGALSLCRAMFEADLAMFYFCTDEMSDEDYQLRIHLMFLHDSRERPRIIEKIGGSNDEVGRDFYAAEGERLRDEIAKNTVFLGLPAWKQKRLLEGHTPYYLSQDELLQRQGADAKTLRGIWELLSSQAHSYPFSFYRVLEHRDRGTGRENEVDKKYCGLAGELAATMLASATDGMRKLFPDVPNVPRCIIDWDTLTCSTVGGEAKFVLGMAASPSARTPEPLNSITSALGRMWSQMRKREIKRT